MNSSDSRSSPCPTAVRATPDMRGAVSRSGFSTVAIIACNFDARPEITRGFVCVSPTGECSGLQFPGTSPYIGLIFTWKGLS